MFPVEYGTYKQDFTALRKKFGSGLKGIGNMNKMVFAMEYADIDKEIERLKPIIAQGGYIPCPDHRISPEAKWENVQYYCDKLKVCFKEE